MTQGLDPKASIAPLSDPGESRGSCVRSTGQPSQSIPQAPPSPIPTPYLEVGAGHTASHLLEQGFLDLHKLGGLDDIKDLFHLPQKHHLGARTGQRSISRHTPLTALRKLSFPNPLWWSSEPVSYLLLGAGFWPVFEQSPDHLWELRQKGVRPAGTGTCLLPHRYSHALSRWHPFPGTAPHSMPAKGAEREREKMGPQGTRAGPTLIPPASAWDVPGFVPSVQGHNDDLTG